MEDQVSKQNSSFRRGMTSALRGLQLLMIQCSVCVISILIVLGLRWVGGDLFDSVAALFRQAMLDDTLISAVSDTFAVSTVSASAHSDEQIVVAPFEGGIITSSFGMRDGSMHEGVDIAKEEGTPLKALMDGTVTVAEYDENGYGHYLVIACGNDQKYLYAHCQRVGVKVGDAVRAGDIVAIVGNTGRSTGSHLHFEWICNGQPVDPMQILPETTYA